MLQSDRAYDFDDLLRLVGGFGRYPAFLYAFTCIMSVPVGLQQLIQVFYAVTPPFDCKGSLPVARNGSCGVSECCANCTEYGFDTSELTSAVSEWQLVCSRSHLKAMTQAVYMAGLLVGSVTFSSISDHFGRRLSMFLSIFLMAACGIVSGVSDCLSMFALFRFGAGAACAGCLLARYVYCVELVVRKHRTAAGFISNMFVSVGFSSVTLFVYFIHEWRYQLVAVSATGLPLLIFWWFIPESPRWLIAENKLDEAHALLTKFAEKNRVTVDSKHLMHMIREVKKADIRSDDNRKYGMLDLLRTPKLRKRTFICGVNWSVNALVFFGLNLNVKNLGGDIYLNFFILCIIEIPAALICWFALQRFGRRIPYCVFMLTGGVAGLLVLAVPTAKGYQSVIVGLAMIGKICIVMTFLAIYIFTVELYPTVIRNTGIGVSSMLARFGGILAPYIADVPNVNKNFPLVIFGVLAVAAGILALWLPETLFSQMSQTVEQAEAW
ncbi:predicted protein, partial [Nematostella vectensis]